MELLRRAVRDILEAAATSAASGAAGHALMRKTQSNGWSAYVMYVPSIVEQMLASGNIESDDIARAIVGYIVVRPHEGECWNAGEVKLSAAQKGYGPLMYQFAMNDYAGGLFPDRGSTSQAARAVWQKYAQRADTSKSVFDDERNPKTPDPADDCALASGTDLEGDEAYLNQAYDAPGDASGRSALMQNHEKFVATMAATKNFKRGVVEATIDNIGDEYFSNRYRNG